MTAVSKRVVHCVRSDSFAGVERYVSSVAPELARRGWDVRVIGGDPNRMRAELGPIEYAPATTTLDVAKQLIRVDRGTIVHAHMTAAEAAAAAARALRRFPLVVTRHFAAPRGSSRLGRIGAIAISHAIDRQISTSRFVADSINEPSIVVLSGVRSNNQPREAENVVLVAQRLEPEKQTDVAIKAWDLSRLRHDGWRLKIAGKGTQARELAELVNDLGLQDSVDVIGAQADMAPFMRRAGIFVATTPTEAFGFSVAEAMAAGLPVIAARGGAHEETIGAAAAGQLFPAGDSQRAAAMLDALGADPAERARIGARLRAWQRDHLSIESHVGQLEQVYAELDR